MDVTSTPPPSPTQALIKRLRALGLSQSEIARRSRIPQPRLSRWENGEVAAGADDALRLLALEADLAAKAGTHPRRRASDLRHTT